MDRHRLLARIGRAVRNCMRQLRRPRVRTTAECSVPGLVAFLKEITDVARAESAESARGILMLPGLEYEIPGRFEVLGYAGQAGDAYAIPWGYHRETTLDTDEDGELRQAVATEIYKRLTEEENIAHGTILSATIQVEG